MIASILFYSSRNVRRTGAALSIAAATPLSKASGASETESRQTNSTEKCQKQEIHFGIVRSDVFNVAKPRMDRSCKRKKLTVIGYESVDQHGGRRALRSASSTMPFTSAVSRTRCNRGFNVLACVA